MRELIEKLLKMGLDVQFSRISSGETRISVVFHGEALSMESSEMSCLLNAGVFIENSEAALEELLSNLQKRK